MSKEVSPCPTSVGENLGAESSKNSQSDREVTLEEGRNKFRESINVEIVGLEDALQTDTAFISNGKSISHESCPYSNQISRKNNINSKSLFPKLVSSAELFEIQIKEIDKALFKFGKHTEGEINTQETINADISAQSQCEDEGNGSGTRETGPTHAREQLKGSVYAPAQSVQQNFNTTTSKKIGTRGGRKLQVHARVEKKNNAEKIIGGKRYGEDHLELPGKRRLVSKDDGSSSFSMVEAVYQPHQS